MDLAKRSNTTFKPLNLLVLSELLRPEYNYT